MANKIIKAQMKQRTDTKANWAAQNPVLLAGELGIVSDDPNLYKVGDGTTAWNALPFRGFDGTLAQTTGNSETAVMSQKATTDKINLLSAEVSKVSGISVTYTPNIIGFVNTNGVLQDVSGYWRTEYISTVGVSNIFVKSVVIYSIGAEVAFFDKDKKYLSELAYKGNEVTKNIDIDLTEAKYADAEYVIISSISQSTSVKMESSGLAEVLNKEVALVDAKIKARFAEDINATALIQGFIDKNGNVNNTAGYLRTDYINILGYNRISAKAIIYTNGLTLAFFDSAKNILQSISLVGTGATQKFEIDLTAPEYAKAEYVVLSSINQSWAEITLSSSISIKRDLMLLPANNNINILVFGDSLTHAANVLIEDNKTASYTWDTTSGSKPWVQIVKDYLQAHDVRDYAKHGASYVDQDDSLLSVSKQIEVAINDIPNPNNVFPTQGAFNPDIVIFALGTNDVKPTDTYDEAIGKTIYDANGDVNVEATLDNLDRSKFYQAVRYAYLKIKATFPMAMTMTVLPIQRAGKANDLVVGELHDGIKRMAQRYSIKVIDGASELGIAADLEKVSKEGILLGDGLHPNGLGRNLFARMMLNAIKCNYVNMSKMNSL